MEYIQDLEYTVNLQDLFMKANLRATNYMG